MLKVYIDDSNVGVEPVSVLAGWAADEETWATGPRWVHEIKHDGYRLIARKTDARVRLFTRHGYEWTDRY